MNTADMKEDLKDLHITAAKKMEVDGKDAIVLFVPFRLLKAFNKVQRRLVRELEKKLSGNVFIVAQRTILAPNFRRQKHMSGVRPRSRTLTSVHTAILEDLVFPAEIVGKRIRYRVDGSRLLKVQLDPKEKGELEGKLTAFRAVYKKLTNKEADFQFPTVKA